MTVPQAEGAVPGPALDRLVAEKVMGWKLREWDDAEGHHFEWTWPERPGDEYTAMGYSHDGAMGPLWDEGDRSHEYWRPSTNIAHAWEVIEKLTAERGGIEMDRFALASGAGWRVIIRDRIGLADTAPLAICRAALAVITTTGSKDTCKPVGDVA